MSPIANAKKILAVAFVLLATVLVSHSRVFSSENASFSMKAQLCNTSGMESLAKKDYKSAYVFFSCAIKLNPMIKVYHNNIAVACMNLKKFDEAIRHLRNAITIDPSYAKALSNLAICHFRLSHYKTAFSYYRKAKSADSAYVENRFTLSKIIQEMESLQKERPTDQNLQKILDHAKRLEKLP
jgi:tetratricopeptide (TPR) repeat protein